MTCTHTFPTTGRRLTLDQIRSGGLRSLVARWVERRSQRRALAELDDRLLRDIGVAPRIAVSEAGKPFWRS